MKSFNDLKFELHPVTKKGIRSTIELKPNIFISVVAGEGFYSTSKKGVRAECLKVEDASTFEVAIIDENTNNNDNLNIKIWDVDSWVLHFDIDKPYFIKLVMFNKNKYIATNELVSLWTLDWSGLAWIWYLQNNAWVLSLSGWITWNEYVFDFLNNDYALFIKNNWTGALLYQVTWETTTGTWIYITPIDDSDSEIVRYIWNEILLDTDSRFVAKQTELIYKK